MTDAEYEVARDRIEALRTKWSKTLGLHRWAVDYEYCREGLPTKSDDAKDNYVSTATATVRWQYHDATIRFNVPELAECSDTKIERIVIHEMMHVLVNEMRDTSDDWLKHEERVCTMLTDAILWTRDEAKGEPKS